MRDGFSVALIAQTALKHNGQKTQRRQLMLRKSAYSLILICSVLALTNCGNVPSPIPPVRDTACVSFYLLRFSKEAILAMNRADLLQLNGHNDEWRKRCATT